MPELLWFSEPFPERILTGHYDPVLVVLSYVVSVAGSYVALTLMNRFRHCPQSSRKRRLIYSAGLSLGGAIWSMHFIGVLALQLPLDVTYRFVPTFLSLVIAIVVSGYAFREICGSEVRLGCVFKSGTLMGLGIFLMHFVGMQAMEFAGKQVWRGELVLASVAIAVLAATAALWLCLPARSEKRLHRQGLRLAAALVMGIAVTGMHYTGMAAALFVPLESVPFQGRFTMDSELLAYGTVIMIAVILGLAVITSDAIEHLGTRQRLAALVLIMSVVAFSVALITLYILYQAGFQQQRERLQEMALGQASLIQAMARFDRTSKMAGGTGGPLAATIQQIQDAHRQRPGFGETGELVLGKKEGENIVYLLTQRFASPAGSRELAWSARHGEPMRRALEGQSGSLIGLDYRGVSVLAGYAALPELGLGLVVKMDMAEVRRPFVQAALVAGGWALIAVALGAGLFFGISNPLIRRLEEEIRHRRQVQAALAKSKEDLSRAEEVAHLGHWVWEIESNEVRWSDETYRILGFRPGEFDNPQGQFEKRVHPDDWERVDATIKSSLETGRPFEMEYRIVWPDGSIRYVLGKADVETDASGKPLRLVGTLQDITERKQVQEEMQALTLEKEKIENELEFAKLVQEGFLPEKPPAPPGYLFAARSVPARFVGGDFYDFIDLGPDRLGVVLGDVSGKGISAALFMAQLLSDLRYVSLVEPDPGRILAKVNDIQCRRSRRGMFATAVYLLLDMKRGKVSAANAGHPPTLVRSASGKVRREAADGGTPLGVLPETRYRRLEFSIHRGDTVLLFTDGVTEALSPELEPFGLERLEYFMRSQNGTPEELISRLQNAVAQFHYPRDPSDDLTLTAFQRL